MFGESAPDSPKEDEWLRELAAAEISGNPQWGALVARNLKEDPNTGARGTAFRECINRREGVASPDEAVALFRLALDELRRDGYTFDSDHNDGCGLPELPFDDLARAVDVESIGRHNLGVSVRRLRKPAFRTHVAKRVREGRIGPSVLKGEVGSPNGVWATDANATVDDTGKLLAADELRDRLGLDDPGRFGESEHMVILRYDATRLPDGAAYRPTVLDAGELPMAAAWLPSDATSQETGFTQHLGTGQPGCPEAIHRPFAASEVSGLAATESLRSDPSTGYRASRLGAGT